MDLTIRCLARTETESGKVESEFQEKVITVENITQFGISAKDDWKKNGDFKKFYKTGWIRVGSEVFTWVRVSTIQELKTILKGKFSSSKESHEREKRTKFGMESRKGTSWTYSVKSI